MWISIWSTSVGRCETRFGPGFEIWYGERRANKQQWQALEATVTHALCLRPHCPRPMNRPTGAPPRRSRFSLPLERMWKRRRQGLAFVPAIPIWRVWETWKLSAERGTPQEFEDKYEKLYAFHTTATLNPNRQSMHHRMRTVARNIFTRVHSMSSVSLSTAHVSRATQQNAYISIVVLPCQFPPCTLLTTIIGGHAINSHIYHIHTTSVQLTSPPPPPSSPS